MGAGTNVSGDAHWGSDDNAYDDPPPYRDADSNSYIDNNVDANGDAHGNAH